MGVGYPPDALPDAPLGVRARISRAPALWVLGGEALSVRATSWGAHSGVQTLRSVRAPSLSLALLSALREQLLLLTHPPAPARTLRGVRSTCQLIVGEVRARDTEGHLVFLHIAQLLSKRASR
jgi:hypothetical protein